MVTLAHKDVILTLEYPGMVKKIALVLYKQNCNTYNPVRALSHCDLIPQQSEDGTEEQVVTSLRKILPSNLGPG